MLDVGGSGRIDQKSPKSKGPLVLLGYDTDQKHQAATKKKWVPVLLCLGWKKMAVI